MVGRDFYCGSVISFTRRYQKNIQELKLFAVLLLQTLSKHYDDVIMTTIASQITSLTSVYSTVYSDADQRKHQSSASLAFVWGIHRDRWIPRTKGQLRGKCFQLITSEWWFYKDISISKCPFYSHGSTSISALESYPMPHKVWKLLIHSQTSMVALLNFGNGWMIYLPLYNGCDYLSMLR